MKKTWIALLLCLALLLSLCACGQNEETTETEEQETSEEAELPEGEEVAETTDREMYEYTEAGLSIPRPQSVDENADKVLLWDEGGKVADGVYYMAFYIYADNYQALNAMSEEEFNEIDKLTVIVLSVFRVDKDADMDEEALKALIEEENIGNPDRLVMERETEDYVLYVSFDDQISDELPEELIPVFQTLIDDFGAARSEIVVSDPVAFGAETVGQVLDFTAIDVNGEEINSKELFAGHKYTMINCWCSWCGPCVNEMPELEEMSKRFEEKGCAIVGLLFDGDEEEGLADGREILEDLGVTYTVLTPWEGIKQLLNIQAVPTSFFVDENGQIIGEFIVGADLEGYEAQLAKLLGE